MAREQRAIFKKIDGNIKRERGKRSNSAGYINFVSSDSISYLVFRVTPEDLCSVVVLTASGSWPASRPSAPVAPDRATRTCTPGYNITSAGSRR